MRPTEKLVETTLFREYTQDWPLVERLRRSYERSKAIGKAYSAYTNSVEIKFTSTYSSALPGLTANDITHLSAKFWQLHTDPICGIDGAAAILTMIQLNLCAGTIAPHATRNLAAAETLERILSFEVS